MKKLIVCVFMLFILSSCSIITPYGNLVNSENPKVVVYSDTDVVIKNGNITSDETVLMVFEIPSDVDPSLFTYDVSKTLRTFYEERSKVYKSWIIESK